MGIIWWKIVLILSSIGLVSVTARITRTKKFTLPLIIISGILLFSFAYLSYQALFWYNKEYGRPLVRIDQKPARLDVPFESEHNFSEYLKGVSRDRPLIIARPLLVKIRYTDPLSPSSPHGLIYIIFKNIGDKSAEDIKIKWNIIDNGSRITPPDEWRKIIGELEQSFILGPNQYSGYLYGPEIGAYAQSGPPNIELTLSISYKDETGRGYSFYCESKSNPDPKPKDAYSFDILTVK